MGSLTWIERIEANARGGKFLRPEEAVRVIDYLARSIEIFRCLDPDRDGNCELCRDHKKQMLKLIRDLDME